VKKTSNVNNALEEAANCLVTVSNAALEKSIEFLRLLDVAN
jgi:hypothetical protein